MNTCHLCEKVIENVDENNKRFKYDDHRLVKCLVCYHCLKEKEVCFKCNFSLSTAEQQYKDSHICNECS